MDNETYAGIQLNINMINLTEIVQRKITLDCVETVILKETLSLFEKHILKRS